MTDPRYYQFVRNSGLAAQDFQRRIRILPRTAFLLWAIGVVTGLLLGKLI